MKIWKKKKKKINKRKFQIQSKRILMNRSQITSQDQTESDKFDES